MTTKNKIKQLEHLITDNCHVENRDNGMIAIPTFPEDFYEIIESFILENQ
jgi:hypothetical protein